jgi:ribonuclease VapC
VVIDTSALIAIAFGEAEAARLVAAIESDPVRYVGAPTFVEAAAVLEARMTSGGAIALEALFTRLQLTVVPMGPIGAAYARDAYQRYGKGRRKPPAVLNLGDCLAYGVAREYEQPLLFKGSDFRSTDVPAVPY